MTDDRRLIEDYLPIEKISEEASREKSVRKGHISALHLWWARRPLVACRAAVYGALVPASRFVPNASSDEKKKSLGRANAAKFVERLCQYPGNPAAIAEAQNHILEAHANRLAQETGESVTVEDIKTGRAPRPKLLDMFAGGGAIPLEALRLGCKAHALELNPVAHVIELCTLQYAEQYGKPDPNAKGCAEDGSWAGLAEEVRHWGRWVLKEVQAQIGDLYPLIPDPNWTRNRPALNSQLWEQEERPVPPGYLMPVAYLWTRTVVCKNPTCKASVPLVRQTWLCKKDGRYVALRIDTEARNKKVRFNVVEAETPKGLGFDPEAGSKGGNATCPICTTVADNDYIKSEGLSGRISYVLMAVACTRPGEKGKVYLSADAVADIQASILNLTPRIETVCRDAGFAPLGEPLPKQGTLGFRIQPYGMKSWGDLFTPRQLYCLLSFAAAVKRAGQLTDQIYDASRSKAVQTLLAIVVDRLADFNSTGCTWNYTGGRGVLHTMARQALPMVWDFAETNPFNPDAASWISGIEDVPAALRDADIPLAAIVLRGTATQMPWQDAYFDAVVTDPPYYDNVPYADLSDFFYVWLHRTIGHLYPEHFASELAPKRSEAIADPSRHDGSKNKARQFYEDMMAAAFKEAHRVLKPSGQMSVVYAHKTTLGWATLVDALRLAGFVVTEAWPLDTEKPGRLRAMDSAALASSILLVGRKRDKAETGQYEHQVRPDLEAIVGERVETLWEMGISGADLVIASIGAGLRAFTRYSKVEYANGEEVPAGRFLSEVETVVLETILKRLSKHVGANGGKYGLEGLDAPTRFYLLWRFTYQTSNLDAGEAIVFANGTHVELDGMNGLSSSSRPLVEKKKGSYRLLDYSERGDEVRLGMPSDDGQPAPLVDSLHRLLWLMERHASAIGEFLREARPNTEQLRLLAQALAGPALKGGELGEIASGSELAALTKLTANWRSVVEDTAEAAVGPLFRSVEAKK